MLEAQARIDAELGAQPKLFAYPFGEFAPELKAWLRAWGYAAFGQHSGPLWIGSDPQALPAFPPPASTVRSTACAPSSP